ncbi:hypothetical protein [Pseudomonas sp. Leaf58]|uniref:hypothetical protein n=1 Tax=unclassified Pseudomonas TaxID=196821 RepID=UPI0012E80D56|nr:hypothetical protein [Pseudomonas sp. Leaf58]
MKKTQSKAGAIGRAFAALKANLHRFGVTLRRCNHQQVLAYHQRAIRKHHFQISHDGQKRLLKGEDLLVQNVITTPSTPKHHHDHAVLCWDGQGRSFFIVTRNNYDSHCAIRLCPQEEAQNQIEQAQAKILGIELHFSDIAQGN